MPLKPKFTKKRAVKRRVARKPKPAGAKKRVSRPRVGKGKFSKKGMLIPTKLTSQAGVMSTSTWLSKMPLNPRVKTMERVGQPNYYSYNTSSFLPTQQGYWGCVSVPHLSLPDLRSIYNTYLPASGQAGPRSIVLESYLGESTYLNNSPTGTEVEFYDVVCKQDIPVSNTINGYPGGVLTSYTATGSPTSYVVQGIYAASGTSMSSTSLQPGVSPFDSPFFNDYFKVVKRTIVQMTPGASHRHTISLAPNKLLNEDQIGAIGTSALRGLSAFTLLFIRPYPVMNCTGVAGGAPSAQATGIPDVTLNYVTTGRIKFTYVQDITRTVYYGTNNIPRIADFTSGMQYSVNPTSGVFIQDTSAWTVPSLPLAQTKAT